MLVKTFIEELWHQFASMFETIKTLHILMYVNLNNLNLLFKIQTYMRRPSTLPFQEVDSASV